MEFASTWLKVNLKSITMFLLAPIPPIAALVAYVEAMRAMDMVKEDVLRRIAGLRSFASVEALKC